MEFNRKHPELAAKVATLIESGLNPEEIITHFKNLDIAKINDNYDIEESFPEEIKTISKALAYREMDMNDIREVHRLLNAAYEAEVSPAEPESFRVGEAVSLQTILDLLNDDSYKWILAESTGDSVSDGFILGACCFSTTGQSRRNGQVEGLLGSIRLFGILPKLRGLCVGRRLLMKVEDAIFEKYLCCRSMVCIPSPRKSLIDWIRRRNYLELGSVAYPFEAIGHLKKRDCSSDSEVRLVQFVKTKPSLLQQDSSADGKGTKTRAVVCASHISEDEPPPHPQAHLPPIFRSHLPINKQYQEDMDEVD